MPACIPARLAVLPLLLLSFSCLFYSLLLPLALILFLPLFSLHGTYTHALSHTLSSSVYISHPHTLIEHITPSSLQGFGHGSVYKTAVIDLEDEEKRPNKTGGKPKLRFSNIKSCPGDPGNDSDMIEKWTDELDLDGLPFEGEVMEYGKPMCCLIDSTTGEHRVIKHKDHEKAYVDTVRIIGSAKSVKGGDKVLLRKVSITLRYPRSPVIGDKFSSRHGQKGTLSVLWPQVRLSLLSFLFFFFFLLMFFFFVCLSTCLSLLYLSVVVFINLSPHPSSLIFIIFTFNLIFLGEHALQ